MPFECEPCWDLDEAHGSRVVTANGLARTHSAAQRVVVSNMLIANKKTFIYIAKYLEM